MFLILFLILFFIYKLFKPSKKHIGKTSIEIVMGKTGIGKTTWLALKARNYIRKGYKVYSNVDIAGCLKIDTRKDLGKFLMEDGLIVIDEAGLDFNARDFKNFTKELYGFFTLHRHYRLHVILSVQFWDRLDIVIRELIHRIYVLKPCIFKKTFIKCKEIGNDISINDDGVIVQKFFWIPFYLGGIKFYLRRPAFEMFDTHLRENLPKKDFILWSTYKYMPLYVLYLKDLVKRFKSFGKALLSILKILKIRRKKTNEIGFG